jgi:hypothetical protein
MLIIGREGKKNKILYDLNSNDPLSRLRERVGVRVFDYTPKLS